MRKTIILFAFLFILTGCTEIEEIQPTIPYEFVKTYNEDIIDENIYCFESEIGYDFCATSLEEYKSIVVHENGIEYNLDEIFDEQIRPNYLQGIPELFQYNRSYTVMITSTHLTPWLFSHSQPPEDYNDQSPVYLLDYGESIVSYEGEIAIYKSDTEFCMTPETSLYRYGIYFTGSIINIKDVFKYFTAEEIENSGLELDCYDTVRVIDGNEYNLRYKDEFLEILYLPPLDGDVYDESLEYISYSLGDWTYCGYPRTNVERDYVYIEGSLYTIQTALDLNSIKDNDLFRYNISICGPSTPYSRRIPSNNIDSESKVVYYMSKGSSINGYHLYYPSIRSHCNEEFEIYVTIHEGEHTYSTTKALMSVFYRVEYEGKYISINQAIEIGLFTIDEVIDSDPFFILEYSYKWKSE